MAAGHKSWRRRLSELRGEPDVAESDLSPYLPTLERIERAGQVLRTATDAELRWAATALRERARRGAAADALVIDGFALAREAADRVLGLRPFDVQLLAGLALHQGKLAEMQTGEGKTLAAVPPAFLSSLAGHGVHLLTFNDYLARRDADWMGPVYRLLGVSVASVQHGMSTRERREAYAADVTYATAKEAGFDFLRDQLRHDPGELVHRPFHLAIVDEADSILIDEARVPLVVAGRRAGSHASLYRIAEIVRGLEEGKEIETDETGRNVFLTGRGLDRVERGLGCGDLHAEEHYLLLTEVNQALHARVLLRRDVDYIVRDGAIELVDELTGRVVADRRWPDGLQAAIEAKEGLAIRPGGRILGSISMQHFVSLYPRIAGMTATALPAANELWEFYGLRVVVIPPNRPCVRRDRPDRLFLRLELCARRSPRRHGDLVRCFGADRIRSVEREITLHHIDRCWEEHLARVAHLREGIHLLRIGGLDPLEEFCREVATAYRELEVEIERRIVATFDAAEVTADGFDAAAAGLQTPAATWTYLVDDRPLGDLHETLAGSRNFAFAAVATLYTGPLLFGWALWQRWKKRRRAFRTKR